MRTVVVGGITLAVASLAAVWFLLKNRHGTMPMPIKVDRLGVEDVVGFFKRTESLGRLKVSPDKIAVALKDTHDDGRTLITLTLFDKATNEVEKPLAIYSVKDVDVQLLNLFGDKDMLVIK
jgi:hypothetical protein